MYGRILVALDGSEVAERILPHVEALAEKFGSTVTLLQATTPPETLVAASTAEPGAAAAVDPTPTIEAERHETQRYLEAVTDRLRRRGLAVESESPQAGAAEIIVERASELGADLIAMTTHGRGGLGRLVFGSVADAVLRSATCPVLLVRVRDES